MSCGPMKTTPPVAIYALLLLAGCAWLKSSSPPAPSPLTIEWTPDGGPRASLDELMKNYQIGLRSDGVLVWRPDPVRDSEAEALRKWRETEAAMLRQHDIDRGIEWQKRVPLE